MNRDEVVASLDGRCYCHTRGRSRHKQEGIRTINTAESWVDARE
jgi:hypothetical protein